MLPSRPCRSIKTPFTTFLSISISRKSENWPWKANFCGHWKTVENGTILFMWILECPIFWHIMLHTHRNWIVWICKLYCSSIEWKRWSTTFLNLFFWLLDPFCWDSLKILFLCSLECPIFWHIMLHTQAYRSDCKVYCSSIEEGGMPLFSLCLLSSSQTIVENPHSLVKATEPHCCQTREEPQTYWLKFLGAGLCRKGIYIK